MSSMNIQPSKKELIAMLCMTRQCWEDGVAAQALMESGEQELLELLVYDMVLRQTADGRLCNVENTPAVTDSAFCIPATYLLGKKLGNEAYIAAAQRNADFLLHDAERAADGTLYHIIHSTQIWADSAAYLPYALVLTGHREAGYRQLQGILGRLYDEKTGLYNHMWDEAAQTFLRPLPWAVGNGWILTGLLRVISVWGEDGAEEKAKLIGQFRELLQRMLALETANHGFHDILTDPSTFEESEAAAQVAYAIYRGISEGLVDASLYDRAEAIRLMLQTKTTANGLVMDAASSPSFDRPGTSVECQAHVLMMEAARALLQKD